MRQSSCFSYVVATFNRISYFYFSALGASSGIGAGLALEFAAKKISLALNGRNKKELQSVAQKCVSDGNLPESKVRGFYVCLSLQHIFMVLLVSVS